VVAVHFLADDQHSLANHFGSLTGDETDKFAGIPVAGYRNGTPLLREIPRRLVGVRVGVFEGVTDHSCVLISPDGIDVDDSFAALHLSDVGDIRPGHPA
jgi:flavin reductase (DIM6/NTAB) family NADH-FMN oxidoreductase RutF